VQAIAPGRRRRPSATWLLVPLVAGSAIAALPAGALASTAPHYQPGRPLASAAAPTDLGVSNFGRILVDPATSHVFVSSPGSGAVVVADFNGNIVKTITGEAGADAMALSGSTLYVALTTAGSIDRIDTTTLKETSPLVTGLMRPNDLVLAGSKLWIAAGECASLTWSVQLVSVDPATTPPVVTTYPNAFTNLNRLAYCAAFASDPTSNPSVLLAWSLTGPNTLASYDVSSGSPVQQAIGEANIAGLPDAAITPDGAHFIVASGPVNPPTMFDEWSLSTLKEDGITYPANEYPTAVATSAAKGGLMVGGIRPPYHLYGTYAFVIGQAVPLMRYAFPTATDSVWTRGVAISPDGTNAFVMSTGSGAQVLFNVVPIPSPGPPQPPTNVGATPGIDAATVMWGPPADQGGYAVTRYTVTTSPGGAVTTVNAPTRSVVIAPLAVGISYTFTVTATNILGTSGASLPSNAVLPKPRPPGPPSNVTAIPGDTDAFVSWSPPTDAGEAPPITGYQITPSPSTTPWIMVNGSPAPTSAVVTGLLDGTTYTFTVVAITSAGSSVPSAGSNPVTPIQGGNYHPLTPARILDTRNAIGGPTQPLHNTEIRAVQITGQGNVPITDVSAVVLNVTVTGTDSAGYLTVYPAGVTRPTASNLNFVAGQTAPNLVEVALGDGGRVDLFAQFARATGHADVIFDVAGWVGVATNSMTKDGMYQPLTPARIMDTRSGLAVRPAPLGWGQTVNLNVSGTGGILAGQGVSAVVLNVTVTNPTAASYLTVFPAGEPQPTASNLNFVSGQTVPNRVIVKVGADGKVSFYNAAGKVEVIVDIGGWFTDATSTAGGARFSGVVPTRLLDTRDPTVGPLIGGETYTYQFLDQSGNLIQDISAVVLNVAVTNPTSASYLTLWPDGPALPPVSDLNFSAGQTVPNLVVVKLGTNQTIDLYNALGRTDVVIDIVGFYGTAVPAPRGAMRPFSFKLTPASPRSG